MRRGKRKQDWTTREPVKPISKKFLESYLETAIWTSTDDDGKPLDQTYDVGNFAEEAFDQAVVETNDFIKQNRVDLDAVGTMDQHGDDFWLTRNGHGAGFWDRGYGEVGVHLTRAAKAFGSSDIYVGDDGLLYFG